MSLPGSPIMNPQDTELVRVIFQMQEQINQLKQSNKSLKAQMPEPFSGENRQALRGFINQCNSYFELRPEYCTDLSKILFVGNLLTGKALLWFNPIVENLNHPSRSSYSLFISEFKALFAPIQPSIKASHDLMTLKQTKDVASYVAQFRTISADLQWDQIALKDVFYRGLSPSIKRALIVTNPDTMSLQELMVAAALTETRILAAMDFQQTKNLRRYPFPSTVRNDIIQDNSSPMEIDAMKIKRTYVCFNCGEPGHFIRYCPKPKPGFHSSQ